MKGLTLTQPYATLVAIGAKKIETRSWATSYRGPIAIHAGKGLGPVGGVAGLGDLCPFEPFATPLIGAGYSETHAPDWGLPRAAIVAVVELADCLPVDRLTLGPGFVELIRRDDNAAIRWTLTARERAFGDYSAGRSAWLLAEIRALRQPIPCRGALGLWDVPADVEAQIATQLQGATHVQP